MTQTIATQQHRDREGASGPSAAMSWASHSLPHGCGAVLLVALVLLTAGGCPAVPADLAKELVPSAKLPDAGYRLIQAWECELPNNHQTGRRIDDPAASGGAAWSVAPGVDRSDPCAVYGPYVELSPGNYVAFFRVQMPEPADDDVLARLDGVVNQGTTTLAVRDLYSGDLRPGEYQLVPLPIAYRAGKLECRVFWTGLAKLRIDRVLLYAVDGDVNFNALLAPQPASTGVPNELPYATPPPTYETLFPHAPKPADELLVVDVRRETNDRRAGLLTIQGLVNRTTPSLYLIVDDLDEQWLDHMRQRQYVRRVTPLTDPQALLTRYPGLVKGVVITDARLPASKNIAYLLASLKDAVPATPRLAKELGLPVIDDLRGRWKTNAEAYNWAFETLWPQCSHQAIACLWPDNTQGLRDYLVQHRIFTFWLGGRIDGAQPGGSSQADLEAVEAMMAHMPTNIPVLGYPWAGVDIGIGEHDGVQSFARYGKFLVGSVGVTNLSVMSGYPVAKLAQPRPPAPKLEEGKVYVTWVMSDGDNLPVLSRGNFPQLWASEQRGKVPMAWSMSPSAATLMPPVADYYYRTATPNDAFVGAVSGIGYTYPDDYGQRFVPEARRKLFDEFLALTDAGMRASDLQQMWLMGIEPGPLIHRYAEQVTAMDGLFPDYGRKLTRYDDVFYATARGLPVFHAATNWGEDDTRQQKIDRTLAQIRDMAPAEGTAFLHLFIWNWGADMAIYPEVMEQLGERYVAVRPDHLVTLARQYLDQRQLLLRAPRRLIAIEGRPANCRLRLDNAMGRPVAYEAKVTAALTDLTQPLGRGTVPAYEGVDLTVQGQPAGNTLRVEVTGAFPTIADSFPLRIVPQAELLGDVPAGPLTFIDRFDAVNLAHRSGNAEDDAAAFDGRAWVAKPGETEPGHIIFGPYRPTEAGRYVALFRLRRTSDGEGPFVTLDAHVGGGPDLGGVTLNVADVPLGGYRCVPLVFEHPGGSLETRVFWPGRAGVAVDGVVLFRR